MKGNTITVEIQALDYKITERDVVEALKHHFPNMPTVVKDVHRVIAHNFEPEQFSDKQLENAPLKIALCFERRGDVVYTNVPHLVIWHSPDGYNYGYYGSGPADLALNYCEWFLLEMGYQGRREKCFKGDCFAMTIHLHQEFKERFLGSRYDMNTISIVTTRAWFQEHMTDELVDECAERPEDFDEPIDWEEAPPDGEYL